MWAMQCCLAGPSIAVDHRSTLLAHFVANDSADDSTTNGSGGAATGQDGTADSTGTSADDGVLALRHAGTSAQTEHHCGGKGKEGVSVN